MMLVGAPAWGAATLTDELFGFARAHGLAALVRQWGNPALPAAAQALIDDMTIVQPSCRPTAAGCLESAWFEDMHGTAVQLHPEDTLSLRVEKPQKNTAFVEALDCLLDVQGRVGDTLWYPHGLSS